MLFYKCFVWTVDVRQLSSDPIEEENGDFRTTEDREHRQVSEREKLRVIWNIERRCYLDINGVKRSVFQPHTYFCTYMDSLMMYVVVAVSRPMQESPVLEHKSHVDHFL